MIRKQTKVAPHPPRGSRPASPSPRPAGRGKEAAERAETDAYRKINFDPQSETLDAEYQAWWQQAKSLPGPERRPTYLKFQAAFDARRREERRVLNTAFRFWSACSHKACKRHLALHGRSAGMLRTVMARRAREHEGAVPLLHPRRQGGALATGCGAQSAGPGRAARRADRANRSGADAHAGGARRRRAAARSISPPPASACEWREGVGGGGRAGKLRAICKSPHPGSHR